MSNYFSALMRSSAMVIGGRRAAAAPPRDAAPNVVEIDLAPSSTAAPKKDLIQTAAIPQAPVAAITVQPLVTRAPAPPPEQSAQRIAQPALQFADANADTLHAAQRTDSGALNPPAEHRPPAAPASAQANIVLESPPRPVLGQALVRAAMQWVATGPRQQRPTPQTMPQTMPQPQTIVPLVDQDPAAAAAPGQPTLTRSTAFDTADVQRPISWPHPITAAPSPPRFAQGSAFERDEVVEISIGAIHLRVDAPSAQTIARPAAPQPATAPRAAAAVMSATPRSALSRRALRRI